MKKTITITVAVILISIFGILEKTHKIDLIKGGSSEPTASGPTETEKKAEARMDAEAKKNFIETDTDKSKVNESVTLDITATPAGSESITIISKLRGISTGTCDLSINNQAKKYEVSATVIYQSEYSTCAGFSVPINALGSGKWSINLKVDSNGQAFSKNIEYEVK